MSEAVATDVFSVEEVARAAGVDSRAVAASMSETGISPIPGTRFLTGQDALRLARRLGSRRLADAAQAELFATEAGAHKRQAVLPAWASSAVHAVLFATVLWSQAGTVQTEVIEAESSPVHLVFLSIPGPGGGGGGGGLRNPLPARPAAVEAPHVAEVSVPAAPPQPVEPVAAPEPPPEPPAPVAPLLETSAANEEHKGVIEEPVEAPPSQGPGTSGGAGTGQGSGAGEGAGSGIGEGSGGGTGGGPYRAGSGIEPPRLLREVKAAYTEEARKLRLTGDVLLEIVIRRDGTVGEISVLRGLGGGLEARAVEAVRQWRFSPARRLGTPVDVIVEVAVAFSLR